MGDVELEIPRSVSLVHFVAHCHISDIDRNLQRKFIEGSRDLNTIDEARLAAIRNN